MPPQAPDTLPANFSGWDKPAPDTLPADFAGFDDDRPGVPRPVPDELKTPAQLGWQHASNTSYADTPDEAGRTFGFMAGGGLVNAGKSTLPVLRPFIGKAAKFASEAVDPDITGILSPRAASAQRALGKAGNALLKSAPEAAPDASALGKIPLRDFNEAAPRDFVPEPSPAPTSKAALGRNLDSQLGDALGAKPLQRDVPIGKQFNVETPEAEAGHTPIKSSALQSFKYDEGAQEFHAKGKDGTTYVYGGVSPEQAKFFSEAESKGKAWQAIRNGSPLVGKIVNGKRIAMAPPR